MREGNQSAGLFEEIVESFRRVDLNSHWIAGNHTHVCAFKVQTFLNVFTFWKFSSRKVSLQQYMANGKWQRILLSGDDWSHGTQWPMKTYWRLSPKLDQSHHNVLAWYRIKCLKLGQTGTDFQHACVLHVHYYRHWTNVELSRSCIQEGNASFAWMSFPGTIEELRSNPHFALIKCVWQGVK